jgi:4a-hydroxytetrahydrobiopterin dehydratase
MARIQALSTGDIEARLKALPRWRFEGGAIRRTFKTPDFRSALLAANAVGHLAEAAWHHPDLAISWGGLQIALSTHEAGGVSERDFALARKIEDVVGWRPAQSGEALDGPPVDHPYVMPDA